MPRDHDVLRHRRKSRDSRDAERSDADPGTCRELEIFRNAAIEKQSEFRPLRIGERHRVAHQIEAVGVECLRGLLRGFPVTGRHVRSADAHFKFVATGKQFQFGSRYRHADIAGALRLKMAIGCKRRSLGRSP